MSTSPAPAYPFNAWYAAAWDKDVGRTPTARTICDVPVVLYRQLDRTAVALEDACLHRLLPLSLGRVEGDKIVCGYHGMTFEGSGRCTRMPMAGDTPPPGARVRSFPVIERHRLLWLWMGDPELADPSLVPDLHWIDDPQWAGEGGSLELACDYRLVLDNLMDLTHETFVHTTSIGHEKITTVPFEVEQDGPRVVLSRWMEDCDAPPWLAMQLRLARGLPPEHTDRWQIIHFAAPTTIVIDVGVAPTGTGAPQGDRSKGVSGRVLNTVTPHSSGRCYYFFSYQRSFMLDSQELDAEMLAATVRIFEEDRAILEAQQKAIDLRPDRRLIDLNIDKGGTGARRAIQRMIKDEQAGETPRQPAS